MKKLISLILALVMVMGLATTAFAEEAGSKTLNKDNSYTHDIQVNGEYIQQLKSDEIISVDVEWGAMNFTYAATQQGTWQPDSHTYSNATEKAAWVGDTTSDIKVTNHSNVDVTANFSFKADISTVTGSFAEATASAALIEDDDEPEKNDKKDQSLSVDLKAGEVDGYATADNKTVTFTIGGSLADTYTTNTKLGTITVSVEKKAASSGSEDNTEDGEKTVTALKLKWGTEIWYNYYEDHDPDWSSVSLVVTYDNGNTEDIYATDSSVTITYPDNKTLEEAKAEGTDQFVTCTLTYKGASCSAQVRVFSWDGSGLPSTVPAYAI